MNVKSDPLINTTGMIIPETKEDPFPLVLSIYTQQKMRLWGNPCVIVKFTRNNSQIYLTLGSKIKKNTLNNVLHLQ